MTRKQFLLLITIFLLCCLVLLVKKLLVKNSLKAETTNTTFLEFGSVGCVECKKMEAVQDSIKKLNFNVVVKFIDLRKKENREIAKIYHIQLIPTQLLIDKNGVEYFRHVGYIPYNELSRKINKTKK